MEQAEGYMAHVLVLNIRPKCQATTYRIIWQWSIHGPGCDHLRLRLGLEVAGVTGVLEEALVALVAGVSGVSGISITW